jgi:hypothetical protein
MTTQAPLAAGDRADSRDRHAVCLRAHGCQAPVPASELGLYEPWPTPERSGRARRSNRAHPPAAYTGSRPMSDVTSRRTRREWT